MQQEHDDEQSFDDAFNEISGGEVSTTNASSLDESNNERLRDEQGRFASKNNEDDNQELEEEHSLEEPDDDNQETINWEHRYKSDLGRQNALQRQVAALTADIEALSKQKSSPSTSGNQEITDKAWSGFKEEHPELASAVEAKLNNTISAYETKFSELESQLKPIQDNANNQFLEQQYNTLDRDFPDWEDTIQTPEFEQWVMSQPNAVQSLMQSNEAADAAYLLGSYKLSTNRPDPNAQLKEKRKSQLQNAQSVPSRGASPKPAVADDFDSAFDEFSRQ